MAKPGGLGVARGAGRRWVPLDSIFWSLASFLVEIVRALPDLVVVDWSVQAALDPCFFSAEELWHTALTYELW